MNTDFVSRMWPHAVRVSKRTGIDPRLVVAQSALETGWGKSAPGNNYFGIKSHGKGGGNTLATNEVINGKTVRINDSFRGYGGMGESADGYADFLLNNPRYKPVMGASGLDAQIEAMGASGYATDPNYTGKLSSIASSIPADFQNSPEAIAFDAMAALGKRPATTGGGSNDTLLGGLSLTPDRMGAPSILDTMEAPEMEPQKATGILGSLFGDMTEDRADQIRLGVNGMLHNPNRGLERQVQGRMDDRRDAKKTHAAAQQAAQQANKTASWLATQPGGEQFAQAVSTGALPADQALKMWQAQVKAESGSGLPSSVQELQWRAEQSGLKPGTPEYQEFVLNGGGDPTNFRALDMQAKASGFQPGTPEYEEFMATRGAGLQAGAKTTATNEANIATGGEAARVKREGEMAPATAKEFGQQASLIRSSLTNMNDAISAIDRGANSGVIYKMLPAIGEASASLRNSMNRLGLDVIGSVTFGALSAAEMKLAMETAVPQNLEPAALREWLSNKQAAQQKAYQATVEAAQHFASGGTQAEYYDMIGAQAKAEPDQPAATTKRLKFNPETGKIE